MVEKFIRIFCFVLFCILYLKKPQNGRGESKNFNFILKLIMLVQIFPLNIIMKNKIKNEFEPFYIIENSISKIQMINE